jgi:hypothetical protein
VKKKMNARMKDALDETLILSDKCAYIVLASLLTSSNPPELFKISSQKYWPKLVRYTRPLKP